MKILVTGGDGLLGKKIIYTLENKYQIKGTCFLKEDKKLIRLDIGDCDAVRKTIETINPEIIIHTAAVVDINECEKEKIRGFKTNCLGSLCIAQICQEKGIKLIHISSDYVFSGKNSPYKETDIPHPINYYGLTKLITEKNIQYIMSSYVIIRPAILYGYNDQNDKKTFITETLDNLKSGKEFFVDDVRIKYPVLIDDVAGGIDYLIQEKKNGIFHFSGKESLTRYEWALKIAEIFNYPKDKIKPRKEISKDTFPDRPIDIKLEDTKSLNINFRTVEEGIKFIKGFLS